MSIKNSLLVFYQDREILFGLAKNDFKVRYAGSYFGMIWAFIQPVVTTLLYWFVFQMGLRAGSVEGAPYVLWLMAGLIPWFYFSEAVSGGTVSLIEYSYLVKKVAFHINILPVVKIVSAFFIHVFFLSMVMLVFVFYGYYPDLYTLQIVYYLVCMVVLVLGIAYMTSALTVFFRDLRPMVNIALQIGIWMTPIMWQHTMLSPNLQMIMKLNPVYYIVTGYRDSLIHKVAFWQHGAWTVYFWVFALALLLTGTKLFNKLKIHFADVL